MTDLKEKALARIDSTTELLSSDVQSSLVVLDPVKFKQLQEVSKVMGLATLGMDHLKVRDPKTKAVLAGPTMANCFLVANQATMWGMNPFNVAPETYVVGGKLAYLGKLIAGVINSRAGLEGRLWHTFEGEGDARSVTIHGTFKGEERERTATLTVAQGKAASPTRHKMWDTDPDQKLIYSCSIRWARRHCPEVILGILTEDELEEVDDNGPAWGRPPAVPPPPREFNGELGLETDDDLCLECDVRSPNQERHKENCSKAQPAPEPADPPVDDSQQQLELTSTEEEPEEKGEEHARIEAEMGKWITMFNRVKTKKELRVAQEAFMADYPNSDDPVRQNSEVREAALQASKRAK